MKKLNLVNDQVVKGRRSDDVVDYNIFENLPGQKVLRVVTTAL